jgi:alpha-N-acetylglucosaminidase
MLPRREFLQFALSGAAEGALAPGKVRIVHDATSSSESLAAQELARYIERMTGVRPDLHDESKPVPASSPAGAILVGRTRATARLISSGALSDPARENAEAYLLRWVPDGGGQLVLLGATPIATWFAVYHYLEHCCGVGFFADGDQAPRRDALPFHGIRQSTAPRFAERMAMNLTIYWYSAPWWDWDDWRRYIDWLLKSRYNILTLWDTPGEDVVWREVWRKFGVSVAQGSYSGPPFGMFPPIKYGVDPPQPAAWALWQRDLNGKIIEYARARGMKTVSPALSGMVPPEFKRVFPHARTFESIWPGPDRYSQTYLHPADPLYRKTGKAFLEAYNALYGTDHFYWLENYLECAVRGDAALRDEVRREIAGANFKILDEVDPRGVGLLSTWTYSNQPREWPRQLVDEHFARVPMDRVRIVDQYAEALPLHKEWDYFGGRPWHFGMVYAFASDTHLHGDVRRLEEQLKEVAREPRAARCVGYYPNEEAVGHNHFYASFQAKLGWNPSEVDLDRFLKDYAVARYGASAAGLIEPALTDLAATVYGRGKSAKPLYWRRPSAELDLRNGVNGAEYLARLRRAVEQYHRASARLAASPLYLHDLNDVARQYLAELYNAHMLKLNTAFFRLDTAAFERHAAFLETLLDGIEELLSHDDAYWLSRSIRKARRLPGAAADFDRRARDILTLWAGVIRDYACRDNYELVKTYYRPRVRRYLDEVRRALSLGQRLLAGHRRTSLEADYDAHEKAWVANGFPLREDQPDPRRIVGVVEELLKKTAAPPA